MMEIYGFARKYMAEHGNPDQWGPMNWPPEALIHNDIYTELFHLNMQNQNTILLIYQKLGSLFGCII